MVQVSGAVAVKDGNLWATRFKTHLANVRAGFGIGENLIAAREIAELVPGFEMGEIQAAQKDCEPIQRFNQARQKIESGDLSFISEAKEMQKQYGFNKADLSKSIFHGVNERLLTLRLYIGAGNLSYAAEAKRLIDEHGDIERYPGEGKRLELIVQAILRGIVTAVIKAELLARETENVLGANI